MGFENITLPQEESIKRKADVVFVIDNSGSMGPVKDEVKKHIKDLVNKLEKEDVESRLGFVFYGHDAIYVKHFTDDVDEFLESFKEVQTKDTGWNEFTLPAIDLAADLDWREGAHRYIVIFTNEDIYGGYESDEQIAKFDWLLEKLKKLNIKVFYIGEDCDYYRKFKELPNSMYIVTKDFKNLDFKELFDSMAKSISQSSVKKFESDDNVEKDIFNVRDFSTFMVRVFDI
ncbi:vWA domain-containing protein [Caminibacter pacificus]|uniref:VWA domain-containing protein n=1 Tax=Caminibacter pacificus TaxID=1424653 RepID=A0AAJ4UY07_9BACT|nr:vWA domain-containing protein [Caminibacter pacificus]QCI27620.1 VWA domain-containing protein [Caminibacter pacificus]ROR40203.1 von Willebrand factor type A domain-containing protein [Caminibacter pacificus]